MIRKEVEFERREDEEKVIKAFLAKNPSYRLAEIHVHKDRKWIVFVRDIEKEIDEIKVLLKKIVNALKANNIVVE